MCKTPYRPLCTYLLGYIIPGIDLSHNSNALPGLCVLGWVIRAASASLFHSVRNSESVVWKVAEIGCQLLEQDRSENPVHDLLSTSAKFSKENGTKLALQNIDPPGLPWNYQPQHRFKNNHLTHYPMDKMAAISQTTFSNTIVYMKYTEYVHETWYHKWMENN